jgi:hypothetical protein
MESVAKLLAKMPSTSPCPLGPSCGSPKKKGRALLLHTAVPKVLQEFLPEFRSSLDACKKKEVPCPAVPAPKGTVAVWAAGLLDIYIYIYIYMTDSI